MSLIKFNATRFPWLSDGLVNRFDLPAFFNNDYFNGENPLPAMNVKENETNFVLEFAVPGFNKEDFKITMEDNLLSVAAEKQNEEVEEDAQGYTRREFNYSSFDRKLQVPTSVNPEEEVVAHYDNGVLKLTLAKKEEAKTPAKKVIEVA